MPTSVDAEAGAMPLGPTGSNPGYAFSIGRWR